MTGEYYYEGPTMRPRFPLPHPAYTSLLHEYILTKKSEIPAAEIKLKRVHLKLVPVLSEVTKVLYGTAASIETESSRFVDILSVPYEVNGGTPNQWNAVDIGVHLPKTLTYLLVDAAMMVTQTMSELREQSVEMNEAQALDRACSLLPAYIYSSYDGNFEYVRKYSKA